MLSAADSAGARPALAIRKDTLTGDVLVSGTIAARDTVVLAVTHRDPGAAYIAAFREALTDRLHQPYREALVPGLSELMSLEHPDLLGVCLSGAGPSIVGFATSGHDNVAALLSKTLEAHGSKHSVRIVEAEQLIGSRDPDAETISLSL
jgi:homoserine kinase